MKTYLFYDLETSGLSKSFDQVLQYASIRTDLEFNELSRTMFYVRLNCDVIPSPGAILTHGLGVHDTQTGLNEYEAIQRIHAELNTPGTQSLGYNTLRFDDEFLRFSFYRNLFPPYTHQYKNNCGRLDLYPITIFYWLYKRSHLSWPLQQGSPKLKLDLLNQENRWVEGMAHDALVDVSITVELAKVLSQEKSMWKHLTERFVKDIDLEWFSKLPLGIAHYPEGLYVEGKIGAKNAYQAPVLSLGEHTHYKNQYCLLRLDSPSLREATLDNLDEKTMSLRKKMGEPGFVLPPENRFLLHLHTKQEEEWIKNKNWLAEHPGLLQEMVRYHQNFQYATTIGVDADAALYLNDFWSFSELEMLTRFHQAPPEKKAALLNTLTNPQLKTLALRILGRHYPHVLTAEQKTQCAERVKRALHETVLDFKGEKKLTASAALDLIAAAETTESLSKEQHEKLQALKEYLLSL